MNNRLNKIEQIKQDFLRYGIPEERIDALLNQFNNLERKIYTDQAVPSDVETLIDEIYNLQVCLDDLDELTQDQFYKSIKRLAKNYTRLFPFLMEIFIAGKKDQLKYAQISESSEEAKNLQDFIQYIRDTFILPMLFEISRTTEYSVTSRYFGSIPIVTSNGQTHRYGTDVLFEMDDYLTFNIAEVEKFSGSSCALRAYALGFGYLNTQNRHSSDSEKLFSNYMAEAVEDNSSPANSAAPRLILATDDVMCLFSSGMNIPEGYHLHGRTLTNKQTAVLSINSNIDIDDLLKTLIHEIQHLYNALYQSKDLRQSPINLSDQALNDFLSVTTKLQASNTKTIHVSILRDIEQSLKAVAAYSLKEQTLDELSAHLTAILFYTSPHDIRDVINLILENFAVITEDFGNRHNAILIAKALSNAFHLVEHAISHLSWALYNFKRDKVLLFASKLAEKDEFYKQLDNKLPPAEMSKSWDACLRDVESIEKSYAQLVEAAAIRDEIQFVSHNARSVNEEQFHSMHSLHHQAKLGNNEAITALLAYSNRGIDDVDQDGLPPLVYAIMHNHRVTVELLINNGASLSWRGSVDGVKNSNLLHIAARYGSYEIIPLLVNKGLSTLVLDGKKQSPLILLCRKIAIVHTQAALEGAYEKSINALTILLCQSNEEQFFMRIEDNALTFVNSLKQFQKNVALLVVLHETGNLQAFGEIFPSEIILNIAMQFAGYVPNERYKNCYRDIILELMKDNTLLSKFIDQGMQALYTEFKLTKNDKKSLLAVIGVDLIKLITLNFTSSKKEVIPVVEPSLLEKKKQLQLCYTPRGLFMGAESLAAITLAKRQLQSTVETAKPNEKLKNERRLIIQEWKRKVAHQKDEGLSAAILQVCKELNIHTIDSATYHKLASILKQLVVKEQMTPATLSPRIFLSIFKERYQKAIETPPKLSEEKVIRAVNKSFSINK